jgi:hypothetical protein
MYSWVLMMLYSLNLERVLRDTVAVADHEAGHEAAAEGQGAGRGGESRDHSNRVSKPVSRNGWARATRYEAWNKAVG